MDLKKIGFSEQFYQAVSPKRKLISGFGLGAGASLLVLTAIFLYCPFKVSIFTTPKFQGFTSIGTNSSIHSWSFPFSSTPHSSSSALQRGEEERVDGKTIDGSKNGNFSGFNGGEVVKQKTHDGNFTERSQNGSISIGFNGGVKPLNGNATLIEKNATFSSQAQVGEETHQGILSGEAKNASVPGKPAEAITDPKSVERGKSEGLSKPQVLNATSSDDGKNLRSPGNEGKDLEKIREAHGGNSTLEKIQGSNGGNGTEKIEQIHGGSVEIGRTTSSVNDSASANGLGDHYGKCNIFDGRWVRDEEKPLYPGSSCTFIDRDFDCHLNGRPDEDFVKWRWQPNGCNIPRLNSTDFLERLRGKRLIFVGDSLNRNMWESLVCILRQSVEDKRRVHEISGRSHFKERISGFYSIRFDDYNCSVDFVSAPFLVKESSFNTANGSIPTLRLDTIDSTKAAYRKADVIVFNTGHWWTHEKTSKGENYYREGNYVYPKLNVLDAYKKALTTWGRWVDKNIDPNKTLVFFRGYSVTHFRGGQWNSGGQCHKETEPIFNETFLAKYPSKMRVVEKVIHQMKTPVVYLNISRLTDFRKDAHPSIYRMEYNTEEERIAAVTSQDCSHWCLPGVPDTWNELLYASLLKVGTGSWRT